MDRAYSDDLRERVAASVPGGRSCRATAERFGVSVSSAAKWSQRRRATGSTAARLLERLMVTPYVTSRALECGNYLRNSGYASTWRDQTFEPDTGGFNGFHR